MHTYRAPSQIKWVNGGWQEASATTVDEAIAALRARGMTLALANIQVRAGDAWKFASEVSPHFGGYSQRDA